MAPALFTYALPTLQLVCHLVTTGNSSIGAPTPNSIEFPTTSAVPRNLPPGYIAYPDFRVAYKVHNEPLTWDEARSQCTREGGDLAIIDSTAKIELVRNQQLAKNDYLHVGFFLKDSDDNTWYSVYNGLPASSLPWAPGEPNGVGRCAKIHPGTIGLGKYSCISTNSYVCQISYP